MPRGRRPRRQQQSRVAHLAAKVAELRASRWPATLAIPLYQGDDTAAALAWIAAVETGIRDAQADTVVIVIEKVVARPSSDPAPWASSAAADPIALGSDAPP